MNYTLLFYLSCFAVLGFCVGIAIENILLNEKIENKLIQFSQTNSQQFLIHGEYYKIQKVDNSFQGLILNETSCQKNK